MKRTKKPVPLTNAERKSLSRILTKARAFKAAYNKKGRSR
jgi:hypothetical protein